jgi:tRNA pseudouridine38-40 synthase
MTKRYAVLLSYIGTGYCGWQIQAEASGTEPSLQDTCEAALEKMLGGRIYWQASGRTDAGVHAMGQVAHFTVDWSADYRFGKPEITPYQFLRGLNTLLPPQIRILAIREAPADFHAQQHSEKKQYSYYFQIGRAPTVVHGPLTAFHHEAMDVAKMNEAVRHLIGEHDFKPFQGAGSKPMKSTVRTIHEAEVTLLPDSAPFPLPIDSLSLIRVRIVGSGFLKQMVRGIAGTLFQIGTGKRPPSDMAEILRTQNRSLVGSTAPAQGLWLERVWYPNLSFDGELDYRGTSPL